ncbi:MAG: N5-carboxyaminoimidazole ribonucleotide synthase, partial [Betaproteobacteria bacterium]
WRRPRSMRGRAKCRSPRAGSPRPSGPGR